MSIRINTTTGKLNIISIYAPDTSKSTEQINQFYEELENDARHFPTSEKLLGDFNARVGNHAIPGIKSRFNEITCNESGNILIHTCSQNNWRINNTYFKHKQQHKITITWQNSRGQQSCIDYIVSNRGVHPSQILDIRSLTSANIGTDHLLVLGKLRMTAQSKKTLKTVPTEHINIESLLTESTRILYNNKD